jgi:osmoprotectant transport system permease protein
VTENLAAQLALLPDALAGHLVISVVPLVLGVALSVPLGLLAVRVSWLRGPALGVVSLVQTVPGLALLALMVPLLACLGLPALGALPAGVALTLYAMLPVVRNTVAGIEGIDAGLLEAARAVGMTPGQVLRHVELPLAAPVILAGVRTAAVWVVGMGTLATPVGQTSLGNFIFAGLQTRNVTAVLVGCVAAAALAIVVDAALAQVERAVAERRRGLAAGALGGLAALVGLGIALPALPAPGGDAVVVAGKPFTEQYVLSRLLEARLEAAGFAVERRDGLGSTIALDGLLAGEIDAYVDYSGTLWATHLGRSDTRPADEVLDAVCASVGEQGGRCLGALGFENAYALAVREADAAARGWVTLDDLARDTPGLVVGGDYEFFQRPEWAAVRDAYGLRFGSERTFDPTFLYEAVAAGDVDAISAYTSDGRIAAFGLRTLEDPRAVLPPYDAVLLLGPSAPLGVAEALAPLVGAIPVERMREANRRVDQDGETPGEAAAWLGLVRDR